MTRRAPAGQHADDGFGRRFEARLRALRDRDAYRFPPDAIPGDFGRAAVLILFWQGEHGPTTLLTRRAATLRSHGGQVSFPGGRCDPGESWEETALRETHEEVGIEASSVTVLGRLDDAWSGARHFLVPVVGWLDAAPRVRPAPAEVAEVLIAPVRTLLAPGVRAEVAKTHNGVRYVDPRLEWPGGDVSGLSADLLLEALEWGVGEAAQRGPKRLADLRSWTRRSTG